MVADPCYSGVRWAWLSANLLWPSLVSLTAKTPKPSALRSPSSASTSVRIPLIPILALDTNTFKVFFASTWGPGAWVVIGEIYPLPIRSRGVALSTASNWLWNCIIAIITPYMVDPDKGYLQSKVFFIWGSLCACAFVYAYFLIPETKGLTLEQVDKMMEETTPRTSAKWKPHSTFAADMGLTEKDVTMTVEDVAHKA